MTIDPARFQKLLNAFKLDQLFNDLGWDHPGLGPRQIEADAEPFTLTPLAQKRGVAVFLCSPDGSGNVPPRPALLKIEKEAAKLARCKDTIDQIDLRLADLYGLTTDEADFIINYDIKYRMGGAEDES